ncbi:ALF repeat-containing protein [Streptomyces sp. NPDC051173]|uniref:ALF repeat-containing protein n=1 Tax=Streptomyces sp. NPDC051173 TaxID=3155164 RepID=UPI00344CC5F2
MRPYGDAALKKGTAAALIEFLQVTQYRVQEEDDRVAVLVILGKHPGYGVTEAANRALNGSAADVRHFLETGQYRAQEEDDRVAVLSLMATHPGEKFSAAANKALNGGPPRRAPVP